MVGHPGCHRAVMPVTAGDSFVEVLDDQPLFERFFDRFRHVPFDRRDVRGTARKVIGAALKTPYWAIHGGASLARKLWGLRIGHVLEAVSPSTLRQAASRSRGPRRSPGARRTRRPDARTNRGRDRLGAPFRASRPSARRRARRVSGGVARVGAARPQRGEARRSASRLRRRASSGSRASVAASRSRRRPARGRPGSSTPTSRTSAAACPGGPRTARTGEDRSGCFAGSGAPSRAALTDSTARSRGTSTAASSSGASLEVAAPALGSARLRNRCTCRRHSTSQRPRRLCGYDPHSPGTFDRPG